MRSTAPHWREIERLAQELDCEYQFDLSITAKNDGGLSPVSHRVEDAAVLKDIFASRYYKLYAGNEPMSALTSPSPEAGLCGGGGGSLHLTGWLGSSVHWAECSAGSLAGNNAH